MELVERFLREAKITGRLEHPSITPVYELGRRKDGTLYYTMKLVRGRTLSQAIKDAGSLDERLKLLPHFVDLCQAIAYGHSRGVIHRDIKPSNVVIGDFGETAVIDWGLAKVRRQKDIHAAGMQQTVLSMRTEDDASVARTAYGEVMRTPAYMSPEQAQGHLDKVDERSDVYSLGAVLYELLTGKAPYQGTTLRETLDKVISEMPYNPRALDRKVPKELAKICNKAMAKEPEKRFASAKALAETVEAWKPKREPSKLRKTIQGVVLALLLAMFLLFGVVEPLLDRAVKRERRRIKSEGGVLSVAALKLRLPTPSEPEGPANVNLSVHGYINSMHKVYPRLHEPQRYLRAKQDFLPPRSWEAADQAQLKRCRELVEEYRDVVEQVGDLASRSRATPEEILRAVETDREPFDWRWPSLFMSGNTAHLLLVDGWVSQMAGDEARAVERIAEILQLGRHVQDQPTRFSQFIGRVVAMIAIDYTKGVIDNGRFSPRWFEKLSPLLAQFHDRTHFACSVEAECIIGLRLFEIADEGALDFLLRQQSREEMEFVLRDLPLLAVYSSRLLRSWRRMDELAYLRTLETYGKCAPLPYYQIHGRLKELQEEADAERLKAPVTSHWLPANLRPLFLDQIHLEANAAVARVSLALLMNKHENGEYPRGLDELVPEYLDAVPVDPFSGDALVYRQLEDGFVLYSVGLNLKDDSGVVDDAWDADIVWRIDR